MYRIPQCIELHTQITALHCIIFFDAFSFPFFLIRKIFSVMKNGMDYKLKFSMYSKDVGVDTVLHCFQSGR